MTTINIDSPVFTTEDAEKFGKKLQDIVSDKPLLSSRPSVFTSIQNFRSSLAGQRSSAQKTAESLFNLGEAMRGIGYKEDSISPTTIIVKKSQRQLETDKAIDL